MIKHTGPESQEMSLEQVAEIRVRVVVHPEGGLDAPASGFWTEVVDMPRCIAEGATEKEALARTDRNIRQELRHGAIPLDTRRLEVIVERAL